MKFLKVKSHKKVNNMGNKSNVNPLYANLGLVEFSELKDYGKTLAIDHLKTEREEALKKGRVLDYSSIK